MATMAGMAIEGAGQRPQETTAPFEELSAVDGVVTSNDDYSMWLNWQSEHFRIRYPDHWRTFEQPSDGNGELVARLKFHRRADGRREGLAGPAPAAASLELPMHPEAPDVHHVLSARYSWLGITGREYERTPVEVPLPGRPAFNSELVRKRIDYSFARPRLWVHLPAAAVLELFIAGAGTRIDLSGEGNRRAAPVRGAHRPSRAGTAGGGAVRGDTAVTTDRPTAHRSSSQL